MTSLNHSSKINLSNEIHSVAYSKSLDLKLFVPKLDPVAYAQYSDSALRPIVAEHGNLFYGHAAIDEKRSLIYFSQASAKVSRDELEREEEPGYISVHSAKDLSYLGRFSSFGHNPHDVKIIGNELIVCNGGRGSNVAFIDLETKSLLRKYEIQDELLSLRHIEQKDFENFTVAPLSKNDAFISPLYNLNLRSGFKRFSTPVPVEAALMRDQILSILHFQDFIFATCPMTNTLLVFTGDRKFSQALTVPMARSLAVSELLGGVIVGSGHESEVSRLARIVEGRVELSKLPWARDVSGAHSLVV